MTVPALETMDDSFTGDVEYLDLDGDGVIDAVRMTEVSVVHGRHQDLVEVHEEIDAGIGVDGVPRSVETNEMVVGAAH